jgi:hypothetical protein
MAALTVFLICNSEVDVWYEAVADAADDDVVIDDDDASHGRRALLVHRRRRRCDAIMDFMVQKCDGFLL